MRLGQKAERIINARQGRRGAIDHTLQLIERTLIVEIARQERVLPSLDRLVQGFLCRDTFGGKLVIALRERGDDAFNFVHLTLAE